MSDRGKPPLFYDIARSRAQAERSRRIGRSPTAVAAGLDIFGPVSRAAESNGVAIQNLHLHLILMMLGTSFKKPPSRMKLQSRTCTRI